ncbi:MAG: type II toxin-antitoxin system HicA family toxin [Elusimicrobiota bacterium]
MKAAALLAKIRTKRQNVRFSDFIALIHALGFTHDRQRGSHIAYRHACGAVLNIQSVGGEAKSYQIVQLLHAIDTYGLKLE